VSTTSRPSVKQSLERARVVKAYFKRRLSQIVDYVEQTHHGFRVDDDHINRMKKLIAVTQDEMDVWFRDLKFEFDATDVQRKTSKVINLVPKPRR
jgi:hypothetical protein